MTKAKPKVKAQGADPFMVNALADRMFSDIDFDTLKLAVTAKLAERLLGGESAEVLLKRSRDALLASLVDKLSTTVTADEIAADIMNRGTQAVPVNPTLTP